MNRVCFRIFNLFGTLPYDILPNNRTTFSKYWYTWSLFFTFVIVLISIWRYYIFLKWNPELNNGYIYSILSKHEPVVNLSGIIFTFIMIIPRKTIKRLGILLELLTNVESEKCKRFQVKMLVSYSSGFGFLCYSVIRNQYTSLDTWEKVDIVVSLVQDSCKLVMLFQLCIFLNIIFTSLDKVEKDVKNKSFHLIYKSIANILSTKSKFTKIYKTLELMVMFESFYEALLGMKCTKDYLSGQYKYTTYLESDAVLIFWYFFHFPSFFLLIHLSHKCQRKVKTFTFFPAHRGENY